MTLVLKLDLDIAKMYVCTKDEAPPLTVQKLQSEEIHRQTDTQTDGWTYRHTHRQTDTQTQLKLLPIHIPRW